MNDGKGHFTRREDGLAKAMSVPGGEPTATLDSLSDFDEDGRPDLLTVHLGYATKSSLFQATVDGRYEPVLGMSGRWFQCAVCDIDGDGRLDIVGTAGSVRVWLNRTQAAGNYLNVKLRGPAENLVGLDAIVEAYRVGGLGDPKELICRKRNNTDGIAPARNTSGLGHSHGGNLPVHIGLGAAAQIDLRVIYPGGTTVDLKRINAKEHTIEAAVK